MSPNGKAMTFNLIRYTMYLYDFSVFSYVYNSIICDYQTFGYY